MKLKKTWATDVDVNNAGYLVIGQEDDNITPDDYVSVVLSRDQARLVAQEIMRLDADDALWKGAL